MLAPKEKAARGLPLPPLKGLFYFALPSQRLRAGLNNFAPDGAGDFACYAHIDVDVPMKSLGFFVVSNRRQQTGVSRELPDATYLQIAPSGSFDFTSRLSALGAAQDDSD